MYDTPPLATRMLPRPTVPQRPTKTTHMTDQLTKQIEQYGYRVLEILTKETNTSQFFKCHSSQLDCNVFVKTGSMGEIKANLKIISCLGEPYLEYGWEQGHKEMYVLRIPRLLVYHELPTHGTLKNYALVFEWIDFSDLKQIRQAGLCNSLHSRLEQSTGIIQKDEFGINEYLLVNKEKHEEHERRYRKHICAYYIMFDFGDVRIKDDEIK
jgi:hypothetical protein